MKASNIIFAVVLALLFAASANAGGDSHIKNAHCTYNASNECEVKFDKVKFDKSNSRANSYRIQQFDSNTADWVTLDHDDRAWQQGDTVEGGNFYRILACAGKRGKTHCKRSRLFWAPTIIEESAIPSRVQMFDLDGASEWARVDSTATLDSRLRQLNVYRMTATLGMVGGNIHGKMTPPVEHSHDEGFAHLENMIHHDVYQQYTEMKKLVEGNRSRY